MIQTYNDIKQEIQRFNNLFGGNCQIQKIYSTSRYLCFQMRIPGENLFLALGRGHGYEGLWQATRQVDSFLRKKDYLLEYMRKYLSACYMAGMDIDASDRIIRLKYKRYGKINTMMFFYKGRELYLSNRYYDERKDNFMIFRSWLGTEIDDFASEDFALFDEIGRKEIDDKVSMSVQRTSFNDLIRNEKMKALADATGGKTRKFLTRKANNIKEDLRVVADQESLRDILTENDLGKYPSKNKFGLIKLNFKYADHFKRRDEVYKKLKKLNKAGEILKIRLKDTHEKLKKTDNMENMINHLKVISPYWKLKNDIKEKTASIIGDEYKIYQFETCDIGVGLSHTGNDQLRKKWSNKEDVWFHLDNEVSPHIIVKLKNTILDEHIFELVASCMKKFAKNDRTEINLVYTYVKNVKGIKGSSGKVNYKKEKRIRVQVVRDFATFIVL